MSYRNLKFLLHRDAVLIFPPIFFLVLLLQGGLHSRFVTLPAILGVDVVGTVEEFGKEVQEFKVGDDVCGILAADRTGAFAEYVCVPQHQLGTPIVANSHA